MRLCEKDGAEVPLPRAGSGPGLMSVGLRQGDLNERDQCNVDSTIPRCFNNTTRLSGINTMHNGTNHNAIH